ncbi:MAG: acyltransferase [Chitinophagaceae bacterium]
MVLFYFYKGLRRLVRILRGVLDKLYTFFLLKGNNVCYHSYRTTGTPFIMVARGGCFSIGKNFIMNNGISANPIGCYDKCTFFVDRNATLSIGDNVGMSQAALICHHRITIEDHVMIGGGVKVYDTDFHSLDPYVRASNQDLPLRKEAPIKIKKNAFIGAFSIILKGVTIGENSIVGSGSIVTGSIPDNEIWAGNPARFIKKI